MTITPPFTMRFALMSALAILFYSCGFSPQIDTFCSLKDETHTSTPISSTQDVVFETPGTLIVIHGSACAKSTKPGTKDVLLIDQSAALPAYVTNATVLLNGWEVAYLKGDHNVAGLGTLIDTIRLEKSMLKWQAAGILSDDNFDDAYQWCYHYTIIGWNATNLNLMVDQTDGSCQRGSTVTVGNYYRATNDNTTTALSTYSGFISNPAFRSGKAISVLPRGFGMAWKLREDHHILQLAYNMGHPELYTEAGKSYKTGRGFVVAIGSTGASQVGDGLVSWETSAIFKDEDTRRDYEFGEMVSGLSGTDLGVIEPPFSILPFDEQDANIVSPSPDVRMKTFVVKNIPYKSAVPVLTGWSLNYTTGDQHILKAGVWIDKFNYALDPGGSVGTLTYTLASSLHDDDRIPDFFIRHKVNILGFQAIAGKPTKPKR